MVSPDFPFPPNYGTRVRLADLIMNFSTHKIKVTLMALYREYPSVSAIEFAKKYCSKIILHPHPLNSKIGGFVFSQYYKIKDKLGLVKLDNGYLNPYSFRQLVKNEFQKTLYDCIMVHYAFMGGDLSRYPKNSLKIIDTLDLLYKRYESYAQTGKTSHISFFKDKKEELKILSHFDLIMAISEEDKEELQKELPDKKIITVPVSSNYLSLYDNSRTITLEGNPILLCVAGNDFGHELGLRQFIEEAFPNILKSFPETLLTIIGNIQKKFQDVKHPNIIFPGECTNLLPYYKLADLVIIPSVVASGLRIKALEAMCAGKAIVSTPEGVCGTGVLKGLHVLVAETMPEFTEKIIYLLNNNEAKRSLEEKAKSFCSSHFNPETVYSALNNAIVKGGR